MNPEEMTIKPNSGNDAPSTIAMKPMGNYQVGAVTLPFDVNTELSGYQRFFISKEFDYFRAIHCCQLQARDYKIYGETADESKNLLFTSQPHFQCCHCCDDFIISCCICEYVCCNRIIFQMDYKKNDQNFYTQGVNLQKGCYFCKCLSCQLCCPLIKTLFLRENVEPDNPDFNLGVQKGATTGTVSCCPFFADRTASYQSQEGLPGPKVRWACCDSCKFMMSSCCVSCNDIEISIENGMGQQVGTIFVPNGICSEKVKGKCCYLPRRHYEVTLTQNLSSEDKFHIIADIIHFDLENGII